MRVPSDSCAEPDLQRGCNSAALCHAAVHARAIVITLHRGGFLNHRSRDSGIVNKSRPLHGTTVEGRARREHSPQTPYTDRNWLFSTTHADRSTALQFQPMRRGLIVLIAAAVLLSALAVRSSIRAAARKKR